MGSGRMRRDFMVRVLLVERDGTEKNLPISVEAYSRSDAIIEVERQMAVAGQTLIRFLDQEERAGKGTSE